MMAGPGRPPTAGERDQPGSLHSPQLWSSGEIAAAYDAIAADYDRQLRGDEWMRWVLWARYATLFRPGQRILDVSCGTGADAVFLAQRGLQVTGIDISPGMIAHLEAKVRRLGLTGQVEAHVLDVAGLASWPAERFDGLISAFAGLSALPELASFAADGARLLRPGGRMVLHLLNRFSLWEWLGLLAHRRWADARRLGRQPTRTFPIGGRPVRHSLYWPAEVYQRFFAPYFRLCRVYSLGVLRPPHTVRYLPAPVVVALGSLEQRLNSRQPFVNWGRFFVLELEKS